MIDAFSFARTPRIVFARGELGRLDERVSELGRHVLVVTGGASLDRSGKWDELAGRLAARSIRVDRRTVEGEPSPDLVDETAARFRDREIDVVLAIGGGSVVDAGKAISAMLPQQTSVYDYLEGIGNRQHDGVKVPFIAVPTTSGTGSEATKNAVLSKVGPDGFKKSIRHDRFVPDLAVIDPELLTSCPPDVSAACGMDAFTQLLESYVSPRGSPFTDALAFSALGHLRDSLIPVCTTHPDDVSMRAAMAYASLVSGITLANAGLGIVHGLASPVGGFFPVPHGVVCGTLLGAETRVNVRAMRERDPDNPALEKYARVGALLADSLYEPAERERLCDLLADRIDGWIEALDVPRLGRYGVREADLDRIVRAAGNKNNPIPLEPGEVLELLRMRL